MMRMTTLIHMLLLVTLSTGVVRSAGPSVDGCLNEAQAPGEKEWTSDASSGIIQVNWSFDTVCGSVAQCYANETSSVDFVNNVNQLPPVQIQSNQFVSFRLNRTDVTLAYYRVTESGFENCDTQGTQPLSIGSGTILGVANGNLTIGNNYFIANNVNGLVQWRCSPVGLRVNITVQTPNCSPGQMLGGQLCSGKGRCNAHRYESSYSCHCCPGYLGAYCEQLDGCYNVTCQYGGICSDVPDSVVGGRSFTCNCIPGFTGTNCETIDGEMCAINECMNNGICFKADPSPPSYWSFRCVCPFGFTGTMCETNIAECASSPCRNGACVDLVNSYKCDCYNDYSGINCETYIGACPTGRCLNGGTCVLDDNNNNLVISCSCHPGYTGNSCETKVDLCLSNPCINSIDCVDYGTNFKCVCLPGYTGATCDSDVNECASDPCQNNGTCTDHVARFSCVCPEGLPQPICYSGPAPTSTGGGGPLKIDYNGLRIAVSVLGSIFGIALIVLLIYCCIVRKPYKLLRRNKYVHVVDETYGRSTDDLSGAHPSPDFVADPLTEKAAISSGSAKSPLVRRAKHTKPTRI